MFILKKKNIGFLMLYALVVLSLIFVTILPVLAINEDYVYCTITAGVSNPDMGTVTIVGTNPHPTDPNKYLKGSDVTIQAVANTGYDFDRWDWTEGGNVKYSAFAPTMKIQVFSEDREYTASFSAQQYRIIYPNDPRLQFPSDQECPHVHTYGEDTVLPIPSDTFDYTFKGWKVVSNILGEPESYVVEKAKGAVLGKYEFGADIYLYPLYETSIHNVTGGMCGDNVTWSFDTSTNTLTISGTGEMVTAPWLEDYRSQIFNLVIEDGVTSIVSEAFYNCRGLMNVSLADSIENMGTSVFFGCTGLTRIEIPKGVTVISEYTFYGCSNLTQVVFHDNITSTKEAAFYNCGSLQSAILPKNLVTIGDVAFTGCYNLTSIDIPDGVTTIGVSAFYSCEKLISVILPQNLKIIEETSFAACMNLKMIRIPNSVIQIQHDALNNTSLETIVYCGTESEWNAIAKIPSWDHSTPNYTVSYHQLSCATDGESTHRKTCSYCDYSASAEHEWNIGQITTPATHMVEGTKTYTCKDCNQTKTEQIEKIAQHSYETCIYIDENQHKKTCECGSEVYFPHNWNSGLIVKKPTHTEDGTKVFTCTDCGADCDQIVPKYEYHEYYVQQDSITHHKLKCAYCDNCIREEHNIEYVTYGRSVYHKIVCGKCNMKYFEQHSYKDKNDMNCDLCGYIRTKSDTAQSDTTETKLNTSELSSSKTSKNEFGCGATFSVGGGLMFLISLGAVGVVSKKKKR